MAPRKKSGNNKNEVFSLRLDPRLKYMAEIAARMQRRSLGSFIEWALQQTLNNELYDFKDINELSIDLWDLEPADRFIKLAYKHPELLTYEEQVTLKAIKENGWFWYGGFVPVSETENGYEYIWNWDKEDPSRIAIYRVRHFFNILIEIGRGNKTQDALPTWYWKRPEKLPLGITLQPELQDAPELLTFDPSQHS